MKLRVLIADDAPFIHEVLGSHLSKHNVEIVGRAKDGEEVVGMAISYKPDVIFMDMAMPGRNGLDATRKILDLLPHIQVVGISSMAEESLVSEAIAVGCVDFLNKSFKPDVLRDCLESIRSRLFQIENKKRNVAHG